MNNKGKQFESIFRSDWKECFPGTFLYRFPDQVSGYTGSSNISDFLAFIPPNLYFLECKSHDGASIPFAAMSQYDKMLTIKDYEHIHSGFIIWFKEKDRVIWVDIDTAEKIHNDGHKSIQLSMLDKNLYNIVELPSVKRRVFMNTDYRIIPKLYEGDTNAAVSDAKDT